jgi:hypothetical protein
MASHPASSFDLSGSLVDDGFEREVMGHANYEDVIMNSSENSDSYPESVD